MRRSFALVFQPFLQEKESKRETEKLKAKEAKRAESELLEARKNNVSLEKALSDARKKLSGLRTADSPMRNTCWK